MRRAATTQTILTNAAGYTLIQGLPGLEGSHTVASYVPTAITLGIALAALLAVVMLVVSGFMYITAAGNSGTLEKAKKYAFDAIIGLLIAIGYWLILEAINPAILGGALPSLEGAPPGQVIEVPQSEPTKGVGGEKIIAPGQTQPFYEPTEAPKPEIDEKFETATLRSPDYTEEEWDLGVELNTDMWNIGGEDSGLPFTPGSGSDTDDSDVPPPPPSTTLPSIDSDSDTGDSGSSTGDSGSDTGDSGSSTGDGEMPPPPPPPPMM